MNELKNLQKTYENKDHAITKECVGKWEIINVQPSRITEDMKKEILRRLYLLLSLKTE